MDNLLDVVRDSYKDGEYFLPSKELVTRVMQNAPTDAWWLKKWKSQHAATMGLSYELSKFGVRKHRHLCAGVQSHGYFREEIDLALGDKDSPAQWWQS